MWIPQWLFLQVFSIVMSLFIGLGTLAVLFMHMGSDFIVFCVVALGIAALLYL